MLDGTAGLWCVNAGHGREEIVEAIRRQAGELDYAPTFNLGHPLAFELATRVAAIFPEGMDRVFFCNSGSEAVDSALKIALAYQRAIGEGTRTRLIGRERGYHGVGFGGISVGGMVANRRALRRPLPGVDHLRHTHEPPGGAFIAASATTGADLADDLERLVALHGAETIAAVIVEPVAGSTGVLVPPEGYLERLREIATKHGILLIFDEVITGFGRLGAATAAEYFGVTPDLISIAKGLTNAAVPMGAVVASAHVYDAIVEQRAGGHRALPRLHLWRPSAGLRRGPGGAGHLCSARGSSTARATMSAPFEDAVHACAGAKNLIDIRNIGLVAAFEFAPQAGRRAGRARHGRLPALLRRGPAGSRRRRRHLPVAAADPGAEPYRPDREHSGRGVRGAGLVRAARL